MRLSWNEVRARAAAFTQEWADAHYEKGETQSFYNEFFDIFGVRRRSVARYEQNVRKLDNKHGFIDLFWPGVLLVEQKSRGRDLTRAYDQAGEYFDALKEAERPRYILVCDFQTFDLYDLAERESISFKLEDLPRNVEHFGFILGVQKRTFRDQDPVNIKAAELVGALHDRLEDSGYTGHDLERFLVRLVFCLFADDTGVFEPRDIFMDFLKERTREDGSDTGPMLARLFQVLDTPEDRRGTALDEDLARFPYVNGQLFSGALRIPDFDTEMRAALIRASEFDWSPISPAIFGSLFQSVMQPEERRKQGAHYTTEKNILKLIGPLFLDDLRAEFERAKTLTRGRQAALDALIEKMARLRFLDPACGCGNFLIITYRELRQLEIECLQEIWKRRKDIAGEFVGELDVQQLSQIDVNQFYGIEIGEFPAEIARAAMWMMDHIMNNRLSLAFGQNYARIPLTSAAKIMQADALELDWAEVLPPERCDYVLGNPPFVGAKYQSEEQRAQVRRIAALGGSGGSLDYVCAWFLKAGEYVRRGGHARIGFVATNSITQGEQVAQLWPILFDRHKLEIAYAHRTFAWGSDARGKAHVHVVIIGLTRTEDAPAEKRLFSYDDINAEPVESRHKALSPYLIDASRLNDPHMVVVESSRPLANTPPILSGSQPLDFGNYLLDAADAQELIASYPDIAAFVRPVLGAEEFINGKARWILALQDIRPEVLRDNPEIMRRVAAVRDARAKSKRKSTLAYAALPTRYGVEVLPDTPFLVIPKVSSARRPYIPIGYILPPTIPTDLLFVMMSADKGRFAILTSAMHMAWLREIGGRLKSDYRYSIGVVYNTFPWPELTDADKARLNATGQAILDARAQFPNATLADLYDPDTMPPALRKAHQDNDRAVDRLYRKAAFASDRERVEHLFTLYERLRAPLEAAAKAKPKRAKRKAT